MLDKCCIGRLVGGGPSSHGGDTSLLAPAAPKGLSAPDALSSGTFARPNVPAQVVSIANTPATIKVTDNSAPVSAATLATTPTDTPPRTDWFHAAKKISLIYYVKNLPGPDCVAVTCEANSVQVTIHAPDFTFEQLVVLSGGVDPQETKVNVSALCVTVTMAKTIEPGADAPPRWATPGTTVWESFATAARASAALDFLPTRVLTCERLTHDTILMRLKVGFAVPSGCHVRLRIGSAARPYTPVVALGDGEEEEEGVIKVLVKVRVRCAVNIRREGSMTQHKPIHLCSFQKSS
jgi:hypothetical protein